MKRFLITLFALMSASAYAETTLRIPVFVDGVPSSAKAKQQKKNQTKKIPAKWFNATLKKAGIKAIPEYVEFTPGDKFEMDKISQRVDEIGKHLGKGYEGLETVSELFPNENRSGDIQTCYTGRADGVWDAAASLIDVYYSDQMGLFGWKYHDKTVVDQNDKETKEFLKRSKVWTNWKGSDDSVLLLTHVGDDGDDINTSIVDRCDD